MYDIAEQVRDWLAAGRDVFVAQVIETLGVSSRAPATALAWTAGEPAVGALVAGVGPSAFAGPGVVEVSISDAEAAAGGLSCGGTVRVLVSSAASFPDELWGRLIAREPVCLTTRVDGPDAASTALFTPATIRGAHEFGAEIPRLFGRGASSTAVVEHEGERRAVVVLWPVPTMVVVGDGLIAYALRDAAGLLGWVVRVEADADLAVEAIGGLVASDAVVVLSHDRAVDGPVMAAALGSRAGYVGGLGSRRTQNARREWLTAHGIDAATIDRIHGPAGLDIDAHTPAEIAVSIVAEILASRSGSPGGALRDRPGPVHVAGVNAPPPRYPAAQMRRT